MSAAADPARLPVRYAARLADLTNEQLVDLLERGKGTGQEVERATDEVIAAVRTRGDAALLDLARRYDDVELNSLEVPLDACRRALADLGPALRAALQEAA
ncbi:MAG: histidinol dehydrogenase, partial [Trueperaceae bacterium]